MENDHLPGMEKEVSRCPNPDDVWYYQDKSLK